jgi:deoxyribodipyrimidine photo-lyase
MVIRLSFVPTRSAGLARLNDFVPRAGRIYADGRNADHGPDARSNVSVLSPYIRHRLVSEEEVVAAVLARHSGAVAEKFVQEVLWRTYWKGWLELRPEIWARFLADRDALARTGGLAKALDSAEAGTTGIEGFDDWARELVETGYLHNHARMWFASIWIFTLRLPWALGADFFLRHLVDADAASNTLSWRWVAGLQTAGKTYLATADNIARYTGGRFSPKGLAREAVALTEGPIPKAQMLPPAAAVDPRTPCLLLLTGEDLYPETLVAKSAAISSVLSFATVSKWPWGDKATTFVAGAVDDARERAGRHFKCRTTAAALDAEAIIAAARADKVDTVITAHAPVGPVADALGLITPALAAAGIKLATLRRDWDSAFWPHATKGFFPFKERIPALLAERGMRF